MWRVLGVLVAFVLAFPSGAAADNLGEIRTLVVRVTHGPETFSESAVRRAVFDETDAWIPAPRCWRRFARRAGDTPSRSSPSTAPATAAPRRGEWSAFGRT